MALNDFVNNALTEVSQIIERRNANATLLKASGGDDNAILVSLRTSSDDPEVVKANSNIDKLQKALFDQESARDALLLPQVEKFKADNAGQTEALTAKVNEDDKTIRGAISFIKGMGGAEAEEALKALPALVGVKGKSGTGGTTATGKRVRGFDCYVDGTLATLPSGKGVSSNLAAAAKAAGVDTETVQLGFFEAQGTRDKDGYKDEIEFTVKDAKGTEHVIRCVRQAKDENADAVEADLAEAPAA